VTAERLERGRVALLLHDGDAQAGPPVQQCGGAAGDARAHDDDVTFLHTGTVRPATGGVVSNALLQSPRRPRRQ
jgi:hypothetical protein